MNKDPAIIFYTSDFMVGVSNLTMEERGQYITLLCLQHQLGHLSKKTIELNIKDISNDVLKKFIIDDEGNYYNERLEYEINKRSKFIEHQIENGKKGGRPKTQTKPKENPKETQTETQIKVKKKPLENEIENENINEIINYLNSKANTNYKLTTKKTKDLIKARFNEGFSKEDFFKVIENKVKDWRNTDFEKYLRPETLFGNKFENYLNQKSNKILPDWFDKELKTEEPTKEEQDEMERLLNEITTMTSK